MIDCSSFSSLIYRSTYLPKQIGGEPYVYLGHDVHRIVKERHDAPSGPGGFTIVSTRGPYKLIFLPISMDTIFENIAPYLDPKTWKALRATCRLGNDCFTKCCRDKRFVMCLYRPLGFHLHELHPDDFAIVSFRNYRFYNEVLRAHAMRLPPVERLEFLHKYVYARSDKTMVDAIVGNYGELVKTVYPVDVEPFWLDDEAVIELAKKRNVSCILEALGRGFPLWEEYDWISNTYYSIDLRCPKGEHEGFAREFMMRVSGRYTIDWISMCDNCRHDALITDAIGYVNWDLYGCLYALISYSTSIRLLHDLAYRSSMLYPRGSIYVNKALVRDPKDCVILEYLHRIYPWMFYPEFSEFRKCKTWKQYTYALIKYPVKEDSLVECPFVPESYGFLNSECVPKCNSVKNPKSNDWEGMTKCNAEDPGKLKTKKGSVKNSGPKNPKSNDWEGMTKCNRVEDPGKFKSATKHESPVRLYYRSLSEFDVEDPDDDYVAVYMKRIKRRAVLNGMIESM